VESVQAERDVIKADLEVEQDARRRLQRDISKLQGLRKDTVRSICFMNPETNHSLRDASRTKDDSLSC
jgi:hypothetical protein